MTLGAPMRACLASSADDEDLARYVADVLVPGASDVAAAIADYPAADGDEDATLTWSREASSWSRSVI